MIRPADVQAFATELRDRAEAASRDGRLAVALTLRDVAHRLELSLRRWQANAEREPTESPRTHELQHGKGAIGGVG